MDDKPNKKDVEDLFLSVNVVKSLNSLSTWYLSFVGGFYAVIGITWIFTHSTVREAGLIWIDFLTPNVIGGLWIISGLFSLVASCLDSNKLNRLAFFLMILIPGVLGFYFLVSWFLYITPFVEINGKSNTITSTVSYWTFSSASFAMARVYEITTIKPRDRRGSLK